MPSNPSAFTMPSDAQVRARFNELCAERDARAAVSGPLREARDAHVGEARETENEMNAEIQAVENPPGQQSLFDIQNEISRCVGALKGQTGEPLVEAQEED
jgi:hypothetical protein